MIPVYRVQNNVLVSEKSVREFEWNDCLNLPNPTAYLYYSGLAVGKDENDRPRFGAAFVNV